MSKWTLELVQQEAFKYQQKIDFRDNSNKAYQAACRNGWIDEVCSHITSSRTLWDFDTIQREALKYNTKTEFQNGNPKAHRAARNIMDIVCSHMTTNQTNWTINMLQDVANKYGTRKEFEAGNNAAYSYARRSGNLNDICSHMKSPRSRKGRTEKEVFEIAMKFTTRSEFQFYGGGAYAKAVRLGIFEDVCSHMSDEFIVTDNDAIYIWEAVGHFGLDGNKIYKIGTTSWRLGNSRIVSVAKKAGMEAKILLLKNTDVKATSIESKLLKIGSSAGFSNFDGASEFRILNEEELEFVISEITTL